MSETDYEHSEHALFLAMTATFSPLKANGCCDEESNRSEAKISYIVE
jgi:hypothetical protein